jgi:hypothetical protein
MALDDPFDALPSAGQAWASGAADDWVTPPSSTASDPLAQYLPKQQMPGTWTATQQGLGAAIRNYGQTAQALRGETPTEFQESPAAAPYQWSDVYNLASSGIPKTAYRLAKSAPTLGGGLVGAGIGTAATGNPIGTIAGGAAGAGFASAAQELGPYFARRLKENPSDPDAAFNAALKDASISGAFSSASWAAFPLRAFQGPLKNIMFQAFGVQPGIGIAQKAVSNIREGQPAGDGLGEAYVEGAVGTAVPVLGHAIIGGGTRALRGRPGAEAVEPEAQPTAEIPYPNAPESIQKFFDATRGRPGTPGAEAGTNRAQLAISGDDFYAAERRKTQQAIDEINRLRGNKDAAAEAGEHGDPDFLRGLIRSGDRSARMMGIAFRNAADAFAQVRSGVAQREIHPAWLSDIDSLQRAAGLIADLQSRGESVADYLDARDLQHRTASQEDLLLTANMRLLDRSAAKYSPVEFGKLLQSEAQSALLAGQRPPSWYTGSSPEAAPARTPSPALMANLASHTGAREARQTPSDPDWMRQATAYDPHERAYAGAALNSGRGYDIDSHAHDSAVSVVSGFETRLPQGVQIGVLRRIEPVPGEPNAVRGLFSDAPDFSNYLRRDFVSDAAAVWDPNTRRIMISRYGTAPFRSLGHFSQGLQGEIHHEMAHAVSALDLTASERNAFIAHANRLGVLEVPFHLYAALKRGTPPTQWDSGASLRQTYAELYKNRTPADRKFLMDDEAIAILSELYSHGMIDEADIAPVKPILGRIVKASPAKQEYGERPDPLRYYRARGGAVKSSRPKKEQLEGRKKAILGEMQEARQYRVVGLHASLLKDLKAVRRELAQDG